MSRRIPRAAWHTSAPAAARGKRDPSGLGAPRPSSMSRMPCDPFSKFTATAQRDAPPRLERGRGAEGCSRGLGAPPAGQRQRACCGLEVALPCLDLGNPPRILGPPLRCVLIHP